MRYGFCANNENFKVVEEIGYDFFESNFTTIAQMSEEDFIEFKKMVDASKIKVETFNGAFPASIKISCKDVDVDAVKRHVEIGCQRAVQLGGKVVVLGSGGARKVENGDFDMAEKSFIQVINIFTEIADKYGITLVIENLNSKETNFINTVEEEMRIIQKSGNDKVKCHVDFFHCEKENEPMENIASCPNVGHVHVCSSARTVDMDNDAELLKKWKGALDKCGYDGRISIECFIHDDTMSKAKNALVLLKEIFG